MYNIKTSTKPNILNDKSILLPSGEICKNKINLLSGAITPPFVEAVWTFIENDIKSMERIYSVLNHLFHKGLKSEMMTILRILFDISGLQFLEDVELLSSHKEVQEYFLFSFLLDMEECIQEIMTELTAE